VEARYAQEEFPSLVGNMAGPIIRKCWNEEFDSAKEVLEALERLVAMGTIEFKTDDD
jgi:hypothetical protein